MKALILESKERQAGTEFFFRDLGVETSSSYNPLEKYDFAFIHYDITHF